MKKKYLVIVLLLLATLLTILGKKTIDTSTPETLTIAELKKKHQDLLENHPYNETRFLTKDERKKLRIPPNAFNEQNFIRTIDPSLGYPNYAGATQIQHELIEARNLANLVPRSPGDASDNAWVERGPNNFGGRTRGILFDPNDSNNERVFAGGVSGGLWVNDDITDPASTWSLVTGVPENIAVSQIIVDPNDSNTFYIASGESYTNEVAIGNGVYQSTDGGSNWTQIFGGPEGTSTVSGALLFVDGIFYINDIIARNVGTTTELYITAASAFIPPGNSAPVGVLGNDQHGVYRSIDNGNNWSLIPINVGGTPINPNDLELDIDNNIWVTSTNDVFGNNGGRIYSSTNGTNFILETTLPNTARTELEPSQQDANVFYVAANQGGQASLFVTTDAFASIQTLNEPNDGDTTVDAADYTRNQAFYDLPIEVDPTDDTILYIGGINLFRGPITVDAGTGARSIAVNDWEQISIEGTIFGPLPPLPPLPVSSVHADQHAIVFRPGNSNQAVFGNDGGIYYGGDLASSSNSTSAITPRNNGYAVTQFYAGDIDDNTGNLVGGTQDNASPMTVSADNPNFFSVIGGDGIVGHYAQDGSYAIISSQFINYIHIDTPLTEATNPFNAGNSIPTVDATGFIITDMDGGNFINESDLDKALDILYINGTGSPGSGGTAVARFDDVDTAANAPVFLNNGLSGTISAIKASPFGTSRLLVGNELGDLFRANNANTGTVTFTNIGSTQFVGSISDIQFGVNNDTYMVTISNYGVTSIWYTENDGDTWVSKEGDLLDIPVFAILQNPLNPNEAIVGTQFGVWNTESFLETDPSWVPSFNGMSNVPVRDLDLRPSTNEVLATTHGRGMFTGQFTDVSLSIEENLFEDNNIAILPTVNDGTFSLRSQINFDDLNIEIYSITGSKVYESELNLANNQSDFSLNLQSGLYLVRISNGVFNETKKMIVR